MDLRISWPLLKNGLLLATGGHMLLAIAARYLGTVARLYSFLAVLITALVALYYGISTNPSSGLSAAAGGAIAGVVAAAAGLILSGILGGERSGNAGWTMVASAVVGAALSAAGSVLGRRVIGA